MIRRRIGSATTLASAAALILVAALLAVSLALAPADAVAKKKKNPKSPPVTVVSNTQSTFAMHQALTVTASCPAGKIAVGGGFSTAPVIIEGEGVRDSHSVYDSRRASNTTWQVSVVRYDASTPGNALPITTSVDCRTPNLTTKKKSKKSATSSKKKKKKKLQITEVSASQASSPSTYVADATATCPAGTQALSGGFSITPPPATPSHTANPWASYRSSPTTWRSGVRTGAVEPYDPKTLTSYAYCAAGLKITEVSGNAPLAGSSVALALGTATTSPCPKGKALLSGGFNNTPNFSPLHQGSSAVGNAWQVSGLPPFDPGHLFAFGYCA